MSIYYKVIDGIRYDNSLIEAAEKLIKGRGDGRISKKDAEELFNQAMDSGIITQTERETLHYLTGYLNWTDDAEEWMYQQLKEADAKVETVVKRILEEDFGLTGMTDHIKEERVKRQQKLLDNKVSFADALKKAIESFLKHEKDAASPRSVINNVHGVSGGDLDTKIKEEFTHGTIELLPYFEDIKNLTEEQKDQLPVGGESVKENWIFGLALPELGGYYHWAVVDRKGSKETVVHGIN